MTNEMQVDTITAAYAVAQYLTTRHESKRHGGYQIYEDEKVEIWYDTYYPNLEVYVKRGDQKTTVLLRGGGGHTQEHHPGKWEEYVRSLSPKAMAAKKTQERQLVEKREQEKQKRFGAIDDSHIFA
jgi:hypothetical protein